MILAIDTAGDHAGIALSGDGGFLIEELWSAAGNHSQIVLPAVQRLLDPNGDWPKLEAIAVAVGPGSFNGLRVGISLAKGLAFARDLPLVGVTTLEIVARQAAWPGEVWALIPAGRGEVYRGVFGGEGENWERVREYERLPAAGAAAEYRLPVLLAGSGAALVAQQLEAAGVVYRAQEPVARVRRPGYLAELGRIRFGAGDAVGVDELEPLYLRRSSAEEKREQTFGG